MHFRDPLPTHLHVAIFRMRFFPWNTVLLTVGVMALALGCRTVPSDEPESCTYLSTPTSVPVTCVCSKARRKERLPAVPLCDDLERQDMPIDVERLSELEQCALNSLLAFCCPVTLPQVGASCTEYIDQKRCKFVTAEINQPQWRTCRESTWIDSCSNDPSLAICQPVVEVAAEVGMDAGLSEPNVASAVLDAGSLDAATSSL